MEYDWHVVHEVAGVSGIIILISRRDGPRPQWSLRLARKRLPSADGLPGPLASFVPVWSVLTQTGVTAAPDLLELMAAAHAWIDADMKAVSKDPK